MAIIKVPTVAKTHSRTTGYKERKRLTPEALGGSRLLQSIDIETDDRRPPPPPAPPPPVRTGEGSQPRPPLRRTPAASPSMRDAALRWDVPPPLAVVGFAEAESQLDTAKALARGRAVLTEVAAPHLEAIARQLLAARGVADVDTYDARLLCTPSCMDITTGGRRCSRALRTKRQDTCPLQRWRRMATATHASLSRWFVIAAW